MQTYIPLYKLVVGKNDKIEVHCDLLIPTPNAKAPTPNLKPKSLSATFA